jgi:hypothetical protein
LRDKRRPVERWHVAHERLHVTELLPLGPAEGMNIRSAASSPAVQRSWYASLASFGMGDHAPAPGVGSLPSAMALARAGVSPR